MRLLAVGAVVLAVVSGCGGGSSGPDPTSRVTEAAIELEPPVSVEDALEICRRHRVAPTQLVSLAPGTGDRRTIGVMVDPGMSAAAVTRRFRQAGRPADVLIAQMYATGNAGDLQGLESEPAVQTVFLKPPNR